MFDDLGHETGQPHEHYLQAGLVLAGTAAFLFGVARFGPAGGLGIMAPGRVERERPTGSETYTVWLTHEDDAEAAFDLWWLKQNRWFDEGECSSGQGLCKPGPMFKGLLRELRVAAQAISDDPGSHTGELLIEAKRKKLTGRGTGKSQYGLEPGQKDPETMAGKRPYYMKKDTGASWEKIAEKMGSKSSGHMSANAKAYARAAGLPWPPA